MHHNCYCQSVPPNTHDAPYLLLTKPHVQQMNPKPSNLAEHNSVLYSLRLVGRGSGMVADICWRYSDAQIRITSHMQTFVSDIKMLTLAAPPNTNETFLCYVFFFIQYTGIQYWAVPMLQIILWHQQITKNLKMIPLCYSTHSCLPH